jgi:hypothetical protein
MKLMKIRGKHSITIHPKAMEAAKFCQLLPMFFNLQHSQESLKYDFDSMITKAVMDEIEGKKTNHIFYAFSPIPLLVQATPEIKNFIEYVGCFQQKDMEPDQIEFQAWSSVFIIIKNSIDSTSHLYQVWELLNEHVPQRILNKYFGQNRISQIRLSELTDHSTSTLKHGKVKISEPEKIIFDGFENLSDDLDL